MQRHVATRLRIFFASVVRVINLQPVVVYNLHHEFEEYRNTIKNVKWIWYDKAFEPVKLVVSCGLKALARLGYINIDRTKLHYR